MTPRDDPAAKIIAALDRAIVEVRDVRRMLEGLEPRKRRKKRAES